MKNILKWGDYIIIGIVLIFISLSFTITRWIQDRGYICTISVNGEEVYRLSLNKDKDIGVQGPIGETRIKIENGSIWITDAPCREKICQKMGKINHTGEVIVCIPNKVIIQVESGDEQTIDGITM
ncbi:NusG domain II-containing protein [bacterium]|nr:NusG domain II-containing protein [bacterium]